MSVYGPTGATAYFGMTDIGRPQPGETVVVSAAAGATGSVAGQIAKIAGARVVGIAGGPDKCRAVVEDFGFDACIDYKEDNLRGGAQGALSARASTSTSTTSAARSSTRCWAGWRPKARVVLCGVISSYLTGEHPGPANYVNLLAKTALMQGFNALDEWGRFDEAFAALRQWEARRPARAPRDHLRRHRVVRRRAQRAVHRRQHRQDAGQGQRTHACLMPKLSAGLLLYRVTDGGVEVLIGHPGGPFWARKDEGAWSIPKGEYVEGEDPWTVAQREFEEELGKPAPEGPRIDFAPLKQPSGKVITAFAVRGDLDLEGHRQQHVHARVAEEGPATSASIPEIDRVGWFSVAEASVKLLKGQRPLLDRLMAALERGEPGGSR